MDALPYVISTLGRSVIDVEPISSEEAHVRRPYYHDQLSLTALKQH